MFVSKARYLSMSKGWGSSRKSRLRRTERQSSRGLRTAEGAFPLLKTTEHDLPGGTRCLVRSPSPSSYRPLPAPGNARPSSGGNLHPMQTAWRMGWVVVNQHEIKTAGRANLLKPLARPAYSRSKQAYPTWLIAVIGAQHRMDAVRSASRRLLERNRAWTRAELQA
jgi:hypothetical protein